MELLTPVGVIAYIDPQVGSYLFQLLIGGLIGGTFAFKQSWRALMGMLVRRPVGPDVSQCPAPEK